LFTATLIAEGGLGGILEEVAQQFEMDCTAGKLRSVDWIEQDVAGDLTFAPAPDFRVEDCPLLAEGLSERAAMIARAAFGRDLAVDAVVQPSAHRSKRLLVADMDSTMITVECIDELADYAGVKDEVSSITEQAMQGALDFEQALMARVSLFADMDAALVDRCRDERVRITPGARTLVRTMKARGATSILVSGGFTRFAQAVGEAIGFDRVVANVLEEEHGRLTGRVAGPIMGADAKRRTLVDAAAELAIPMAATLAVGDGANDIPMLRAAGLGVAYRAKPATSAAAGARIDHHDLSALLYAQGYGRADWVAG
jgi:phosphoserine phosphatase